MHCVPVRLSGYAPVLQSARDQFKLSEVFFWCHGRSIAHFVTYYVALPFIRTENGSAPGAAQECQSEGAAIRRAEGMSRDPANAAAIAFKRSGDPNVGEFSDAVVLKRFGDVPEDLSEL